MNWMKKVAVALVCLLPLGLQAAKVDTLQVKSPSMNKSIEAVSYTHLTLPTKLEV